MARPNELFTEGFQPSLSADTPDIFSEIRELGNFIWEELKPFPGRGHAVVRLVTAAVSVAIISETLRIPNPAFSAYLIFFIANEDGVGSIKLGLAAMAGLTLALIMAMGVTICFMDAPWFRLPATFLLIAGTTWLSRTLVAGVLGRMMAVILVLYLSLADVIFDPEMLTESTLWLWSIVGVAVGVTVLTSVLLEPRPDLLLRAQIVASLESVRHLLETLVLGRPDRLAEGKALRRQVYAIPQRMRQLLARWRQRTRLAQQHDVDWELGIFIVERLLSVAAALAASNISITDERTRLVLARLGRSVDGLKQAVQDRNRDAIRSLTVPSTDDLPDSVVKAGMVELAVALSDSRSVLAPYAEPGEETPIAKAAPPKPWTLVPDALTNPEYFHFAIKTTLAILACEIFMNAVNWPGIRTSMITCAVTALATVGAQRQKQLLRLTGACVGGLMGLASVLFLVPQMDSIVGLSLLIAAGTACCAWVGAGSVRSSYAGFQMALAFFIMLLPGFETSIDLTAIRDRFVGILVGITAMWIFFDHLWHASSRRQMMDKLIALLHLMAKAPGLVTPAMPPIEARKQMISFRRELYNELGAARLFLDETKIELALAIDPKTVRGKQLETMATEVSFTGFLLLALNEKKLRSLASGQLASSQPLLQQVDEALAQSFIDLANAFHQFQGKALLLKKGEALEVTFSHPNLDLTQLHESDSIEFELRFVYETLQGCVRRIADLNRVVQALPDMDSTGSGESWF
jgi:multidrug resistance protein MdtO